MGKRKEPEYRKPTTHLGGFEVGEDVDYNAVIDAPIEASRHTIRYLLPAAQGNFDEDMAWLTGKPNAVTLASLSHAEKPGGGKK